MNSAASKFASARGYRQALAVAAILGALAPTVAFSAPSARIVASRTSGPAPLAVFFDATSTTDSTSSVNEFRDLGYRFTFGDTGSGNWQYSGRPRNEQVGGPLAAHVFEQPGTYVVQVQAKDAAGASSVASVTITVQSADATYAGSETVCLSRSSDFAGCPAGAQQISSAGQWPAFQSSHRYLLKRGHDFRSLGDVSFGAGSNGLSDAQLGAFGSGAKPIVSTVTLQSGNTPVTSWHHRVAVMELDAEGIVQDVAGSDVLLFRNSITRGGMINFAASFGYFVEHSSLAGWRNPENIFIVENNIDRNYSTASNPNPMGIAGNGVRLAIMGNLVTRTHEHNVRIWQAHKAIFAHNSFTGQISDQIRGTLKLHAGGLNPVAEILQAGVAHRQRSSQIVIADNQLGSSSSNINWLAGTAPQNNHSAEGIELVIWEDNQFRHGSNYFQDMTWAGRQMAERGNRNVTDNRAGSVIVAPSDGLPADWRGPYFPGGSSMKLRFAGTNNVAPREPTALHVE